MAFYNRYLAQPVQKFVDLFGKVQPLDVVEYGGVLVAKATAPQNTLTAILGPPPAGFVYRLHRFISANGAGLLNGTTTNDTYGVASQSAGGAAATALPDNLMGQVVSEGLSVFGSAGAYFLTYDVITTPSIS